MKEDKLFSSCNSEKEIMAMLFKLAEENKYPRQQLLGLANKRRNELKGNKEVNLKVIRFVVEYPAEPEVNGFVAQSLIVNSNSARSSNFSFISGGRYAF